MGIFDPYMIAGVGNIIIATLLFILSIRHMKIYIKGRMVETLLVFIFDFTIALTSGSIGIFEIINQVRRADMPPGFNMVWDLMVVAQGLTLMLLGIRMLEWKIGQLIPLGFLISDILTMTLFPQFWSIVRSLTFGIGAIVSVIIFMFIYSINKSIKSLSFALGIFLLSFGSLFVYTEPPIFYIAMSLLVLGAVIIFMGNFAFERKKPRTTFWIEEIYSRSNVEG